MIEIRKILTSLLVIGVTASAAFGASQAFFNDTETSTGNVLGATSFNLEVGSQYSSNGGAKTTLGLEEDNNNRALFNFSEIQPGDWGIASFRFRETENEAYVCASSEIQSTLENGRTEAEQESGDTTGGVGELQDFIQVATFADENENGRWDAGEPINYNQAADSDGFSLSDISGLQKWIPVADNTNGGSDTWLTTRTIQPNQLYAAGLIYCFGGFDVTDEANAVFSCDGSIVPSDTNVAQTDSITTSIEFYAEQAENNQGFVCSSL